MKQNLDTKQDGWYVATEPRKKKVQKSAIKRKNNMEEFIYKLKEERIKSIFFCT